MKIIHLTFERDLVKKALSEEDLSTLNNLWRRSLMSGRTKQTRIIERCADRLVHNMCKVG